MFDGIFEHVDDPPARPVADDPPRVIKWLKHHVREPLDMYFAYADASVQDIKASARGRRASQATPPRRTLLTYMDLQIASCKALP